MTGDSGGLKSRFGRFTILVENRVGCFAVGAISVPHNGGVEAPFVFSAAGDSAGSGFDPRTVERLSAAVMPSATFGITLADLHDSDPVTAELL